MSDRELEEYIRTIDAKFESHIEKGTIEMTQEYYNLVEEKMARLINENQQLREKHYFIQGGRGNCKTYLIKLEQENQQLKEEINKISKKELKVRDMLYSIENGTLTRERLMQIEEVLFELGEKDEQ